MELKFRAGSYFAALLLAAVSVFACSSAAEETEAAADLLFAGSLEYTEGIARCPDGDIFIGGEAAGKVYRLSGEKMDKLEEYAGGMEHVAGLACGPGGVVYALEYGKGNVVALKKNSDGGVEKEMIAEGLSTPNGITVKSDGTLFVSESDRGRVVEIAPGGEPETLVSGISFANGLALNGDETLLFVAATTPGKIYMAPLGKHRGKKKTLYSGLQTIDGITVDGDGNLYACLFSVGQVVRIAPKSKPEVIAGNMKFPASPVIKDGFLYVTSLKSKGIYRIPLDGD